MQEKQKVIVKKIHKKGLKEKVPRHVLLAFCHVIKKECKGKTTYERISYDL